MKPLQSHFLEGIVAFDQEFSLDYSILPHYSFAQSEPIQLMDQFLPFVVALGSLQNISLLCQSPHIQENIFY